MRSIDMEQIIEAKNITIEFPINYVEEKNLQMIHDDIHITSNNCITNKDIEMENHVYTMSHHINCVVTQSQNEYANNSNSLVTQSPSPKGLLNTHFGPLECDNKSIPNPNIYIHVILHPGDYNIDESYHSLESNLMNQGNTIQLLDSNDGSTHAMLNSLNPDAQYHFNVIQGQKLEIHKEYEDALLQEDEKWPFLLRFPIGFFGICLGLGSQTILWKTLSIVPLLHLFVPLTEVINLTLWCVAIVTFGTILLIYSAKCIFYFQAVRREFNHPIRINFFFAPWITCMFLLLGVPPIISETIHPRLLVLFMAPILTLQIKVYGQWLSGGKRKLCKVANPSTHLSLVGNFVGALLAANLQIKEVAIFFWAVGLAHYLVLFVTLYQQLPTSTIIPKELHPVYFLFIAAPSTASVAWARIVNDFDFVSRISYFVGLFLFSSLVVRLNLFCGFRFNISWWAYTFPMTASAIASIHYSLKINYPFAQGFAILLSLVSLLLVCTLSILTILHVFLWCTMFPNDMDITRIGNTYNLPNVKGLQKNNSSIKCSLSNPFFQKSGDINVNQTDRIQMEHD